MEGIQNFDLKAIQEQKAGWINHELTFQKVRAAINLHNEGRPYKEQVRLGANTTAIALYNSFINSFNAGDCEFIVLENGAIYIETSKWLMSSGFIATCADPRTAANHLKRIQNAIKDGCKVFLPNWVKPTKNHRFDANVRIKINTELLVFEDRRERFTSKKRA